MSECLLAKKYQYETNARAAGIPTTGISRKELAVTRAFSNIHTVYDIWFMEECKIGELALNTNRHWRKWSRRKTHLSLCQD